VDGAARWLRAESGCSRVAVIGIGLGGIVARVALAQGAPIDDLALWGVPARGRSLLRELRAFARLTGIEVVDPDPGAPPPLPEGYSEISGFVISADTKAALEATDLASLDLPDAAGRRVLLLERDGVPVDDALKEGFAARGAPVAVMPGDGFGAMTNHPQEAVLPRAVVDGVLGWLAQAPAGEIASGDAPEERETLELGAVRERAFAVPRPGGDNLFGVLTDPIAPSADGLAVVLVNPGSVRRTGPNRMWVEVARRWAARGVPVLRLEVEGVGDSGGDGTPYKDTAVFYEESFADQVSAALDELQAQGVASRFVVGGLCSSSYWAFHALLDDERVRSGLLLNLFCFFWDPVYAERAHVPQARKMLRPSWWLKLIRGKVDRAGMRRFARWIVRAPFKLLSRLGRGGGDEIDRALDALRDDGKRAVLWFCPDEPLLARMERDGRIEHLDRWPNLELRRLTATDHVFRAVWMQRQVHAELDETIGRELELLSGERPPEAALAQ
jgi:hypothetical protein